MNVRRTAVIVVLLFVVTNPREIEPTTQETAIINAGADFPRCEGHAWEVPCSHLVEDDPLAADRSQALEIQVPDVSQRQVRHRKRRMSDHAVSHFWCFWGRPRPTKEKRTGVVS